MYKYFAGGLVVIIILFAVWGPIPVPSTIGRGDFRAYWSAAYLLTQSENFADVEQLLLVEQQHTEWKEDFAVLTWNPPWLLALLLPYTTVSFVRATWLWLLTNIMMIFTGSILLWKTFAKQASTQRRGHLASLIGLLFLPSLITLLMGQVNTLVFFGVAAFLFFAKRKQFFVAGLCLGLTLVKPHLVYITLPIILLHMVWTRRDFRALAGLTVGIVALTAVVFALRPSFLSDYTQTVSQGSLLAWETPTLGGVLATTLGWQWARLMGIVILPLAVWQWWRYHNKIDLSIWVSGTLLLSVITAPFGWAYDVIVLLIPLIQIFVWIADGKYNQLEAFGWAVLFIGINLGAIYQRTLGIHELQAYWVPIAIALAYFLAYYRLGRSRTLEKLWN